MSSFIPKQITASSSTCAIDFNIFNNGSSNLVKCWGANEKGQLGIDNTTHHYSPSLLTGINFGVGKTVKFIAAGDGHVCSILNNDDLICWGSNSCGQIGHWSIKYLANPFEIKNINLGTDRKCKKLSCGGAHTCSILDDDTIKCWGFNCNGQIGDGTKTIKFYPTLVILSNTLKPISISSGYHHNCIILTTGDLMCWGINAYGELGDGTTEDRTQPVSINLGIGRTAKFVATGYSHTCVLLDDDSLKCWGMNWAGQLGDGSTVSKNDASKAISVNFGPNRFVKSVSAGGYHNCAILDDNTLKCWGENFYGQLGDGTAPMYKTDPSKTKPINLGGQIVLSVNCGQRHTCAVSYNNRIYCWGRNQYGQLGDGDTYNRHYPYRVLFDSAELTKQPTFFATKTPTKEPVVENPTFSITKSPTKKTVTKKPTNKPTKPTKPTRSTRSPTKPTKKPIKFA